MAKRAMELGEVVAAGQRDGVEEVNDVLREQGIETVLATLAPGHVSWDEGAINAGAAQIAGVPEHLEETYYKAYARAARELASELRAKHEASGGDDEYVAIGDDGTRPVVWGVGRSEDAARDDAQTYTQDFDAPIERVVRVSADVAARVRAGTVGVEDLGI